MVMRVYTFSVRLPVVKGADQWNVGYSPFF